MGQKREIPRTKVLGFLAASILVVLAFAIALYIAPTTVTPHAGTGSREAENLLRQLPEGFSVYVLATEENVERLREALGRLGVPARLSTTLEPAHAAQATALLVDSEWAHRYGATLRDTVREALASGKPVAVIGRDADSVFIEIVGRDFIASQFTLWIYGGEPGPNKTASFRLKPEVTMFAVHAEKDKRYIPRYFIVEGTYPLGRLVAELLDWIIEVVSRRAGSTPSITKIFNFTLIGWINWKTSSIEYYGMKAGRMEVRSEYYYYDSQRANGKLYRHFSIS